MALNQYGDLAQHYWRIHRPAAYARLPDPRSFFSRLGDQVATQVDELALTLAGPDSPGEGYLHKVGRLNTARSQAEEIVLADLVYLQAEDPDASEDPDVESEREVPLSESTNPFDRMRYESWRAEVLDLIGIEEFEQRYGPGSATATGPRRPTRGDR